MTMEIRRITLVRFNIKKWLECLPLFIVPPFPIDSITFYESHGRIEHRKEEAPPGYGGACNLSRLKAGIFLVHMGVERRIQSARQKICHIFHKNVDFFRRHH